MIWTLTLVYLASAIVTTVIVSDFSRAFIDDRRPPSRRSSLAVLAGLVWPILLLGLVELGLVMLYARVHARDYGDARVDVLV